MSPKDWFFNRNVFNLFFTNGMDAHKSEFGEEPIMITFLALGKFCSSIRAIKLFHRELDLKTKLFLDISNVTIGK